MRYEKSGTGTSAVEVTNVSVHGLWLYVHEKEVFLSYEHFPWFREAPIGKVLHVELPSEQHLYWPELDVDLELDSIFHPERYPLVSRVQENEERYASRENSSKCDQDKVDDSVLALLQLTLHDGERARKDFDGEVLSRLCEKGYLSDSTGQSESVVLTDQGMVRSKALFEELFGCE